jgi:hypothetical protein
MLIGFAADAHHHHEEADGSVFHVGADHCLDEHPDEICVKESDLATLTTAGSGDTFLAPRAASPHDLALGRGPTCATAVAPVLAAADPERLCVWVI